MRPVLKPQVNRQEVKPQEELKTYETSIDFGNRKTKGARYNEQGELVLANIDNRVQAHASIDKLNSRTIEYNGKTLIVGVGELNNNIYKHTRDFIMEQTLVMLNELFPNEHTLKVKLKTGIPADHFFNVSYVENFKEKFITNKWIEYKVTDVNDVNNMITKRVYIESVVIGAEGYSAFVAMGNKLGIRQKLLIVDVGGGTTDLCSFEYQYETKSYKPVNVLTIDKGVIDLTSEITNYMNDMESADISYDQIDYLLRNNIPVVEYGAEELVIADYMHIIEPTVSKMINKITNKFGQLNGYFIAGVGGGYSTFNAIANKYIKSSIDVDDTIKFYANCIGYLKQ